MDRVVLGYELAPDQIQALNPLFIVVFIGGTLIYRTYIADPTAITKPGMAPTTKMLIGFLLTSGCMVVMAVAGYLAGQKQDAIRVTTKEGEIILPMSDVKPADVVASEGKAAFAFPNGMNLSVNDWSYNEDKKRASFSSGELKLTDGKTVTITDGRINFDKSRDVFATGTITPAGALETKLRPGDYPIGDDKLVIGTGNTSEVKKGEIVAVPAEEKKPTGTLEKIDWVKPAERVTVWWMALAFLVITVAEILISVTGLELAFVVAPPSMKGFITGCWLLTVALANWFINAPISGIYPKMDPGHYFLMLAGFGLLVAILFVPISNRFRAAMAGRTTPTTDLGTDRNQEEEDYRDR
jgi:hypothetical protein